MSYREFIKHVFRNIKKRLLSKDPRQKAIGIVQIYILVSIGSMAVMVPFAITGNLVVLRALTLFQITLTMISGGFLISLLVFYYPYWEWKRKKSCCGEESYE